MDLDDGDVHFYGRLGEAEGVARVSFDVQRGHRDPDREEGSHDHHDEGVYRLP